MLLRKRGPIPKKKLIGKKYNIMEKDFEKIFTYIYDNEVWGKGSGGGSMIENNREYIKILEELLKDLNINSVIDFGCGDWQFSKYVNWGNSNYIGMDCVKSVIESNINNFKKDKINFIHSDGNDLIYTFADLLIAKDVFQHWNDESIVEFLSKTKGFKYILITNTINGNWKHPTEEGLITRPINGDSYPLNLYNIKKIADLNKGLNDEKEVLLLTN